MTVPGRSQCTLTIHKSNKVIGINISFFGFIFQKITLNSEETSVRSELIKIGELYYIDFYLEVDVETSHVMCC